MQPSIKTFFGSRLGEERAPEIWDLFCGGGGFSCGASQAGCAIAFACDNNKEALECHRKNHPHATHLLASMPCEIKFPTDGRLYHIHGSPPCQSFSKASGQIGLTDEKVKTAAQLVTWFVNTAVGSTAMSWSMEQVASPIVLAILSDARNKDAGRVDYDIFDFSLLGVPQSRRRVIAGTPNLIAKLRRRSMFAQRARVCDFLPQLNQMKIRNGKGWIRSRKMADGAMVYEKASYSDMLKETSQPSPTIVAVRPLQLIEHVDGGIKVRQMLLTESATLQTFPQNYRFPSQKCLAQRLVGNAVPPAVARALMEPCRYKSTD